MEKVDFLYANLTPHDHTSERCINFVNAMATCNLSQFNHVSNVNNVLLDLVFSNSSCVNHIFKCTDPLLTVDHHHYPVEISISVDRNHRPLTANTTYLNFKRADYNNINASLDIIDWQSEFASANARGSYG